MAVSNDDGISWTRLYDLSKVGLDHDMTNAHFINVSMSIVNSSSWPGLPYSGDNLLIFGSGAYRKSNVYLAAMPADLIATKSTLRYLTGFIGDSPVWGTDEAAALALFNHTTVGEFSCCWISQLGKWVMLYNSGSPRGITMRTADNPWGPWSAGTVILEPWGDGGYARFMHVSWSGWGRFDAFHDGLMGGANVWGGEYGPYLIPRFTKVDSAGCQLYYTMSTWNPYQVILVRSEVGAPITAPPAASGAMLFLPGDAGWTKTTGTWFVNFSHNNTPWISTLASSNADQGIMYQWLPRDMWNKSISFSVHGGNSEVILIEGGGDIPTTGDFTAIYNDIKDGAYGDVIQCTWGHEDNTIDIPVTWNLAPFDRANLKIVIIDHLVSSWGFVAVSRMTLTRNEPDVLINSWLFY